MSPKIFLLPAHTSTGKSVADGPKWHVEDPFRTSFTTKCGRSLDPILTTRRTTALPPSAQRCSQCTPDGLFGGVL